MSGAGGGKTPPKTPEVPADFNKAFRDDEKKVVQYFKNNPSLYPGMKVERTTSDDPEDGNDTFRIQTLRQTLWIQGRKVVYWSYQKLRM